MTGIILSMFLVTSYHQPHYYEPKTYNLVKQLSLLAIDKLDYYGCDPISNYYATDEYFAFENLCEVEIGNYKTKLRYITYIYIKKMSFTRFNEGQF